MKRLLAVLIALLLMLTAAYAEEELFAVEEEYAFAVEEEPVFAEEETAVSEEELVPVEAVEEIEAVEAVEEEPVEIEEEREETNIASGTWGTCNWEIDADGVLTIHEGTGEKCGYFNRPGWDEYRSDISSVFVTEAVAFPESCGFLFNRFDFCESMEFSGVDTTHVIDMSSIFYGCSSLMSLNISSFDTSRVTSMESMFYGCSSLESLDLGSFDTSQVTSMDSMFYGCSSLDSLDLSSFDTSQVTSMGGMFFGCSSLTALDLSGLDTRNVTYTSYMFYNCKCMKSLNITGFDTSSVTSMESMFYGCSSLMSLDITGFDTSSVTTMGSMFYGCSSLTALDVTRLDTSHVKNMANMFYNCRSLGLLDAGGFKTGHVTNMGSMFYGCSSLTSLDVTGFDTSHVTNMNFMFYKCNRLETLDVTGFNTKSVTDMRLMFYDCITLQALDVSGFDTSHVTEMSGMFLSCTSLQTLDVSGFDTSCVTDMASMFKSCDSLVSVSIGEYFVFKEMCTLPNKTWYAKSNNQPYTAEEIATSRNNIADTYSTKPFIDAPAAVTGLTAQPVDTNASRLTWAKADNATGYQLWRSDNGGEYKWIKNCTTTVVNNYSLTPGADYKYKVRAYAEAYGFREYGPFSDEVSVHILGKIGNFTVTGKDTNCAFLKWDAAAGCTGYQVFRTVAGSGEYTWVKNATTAQVANYSLKPGTTYYYKIRAYIDLPGGKRAYGQYSDGVKVSIQPQAVVTLQGGDRQVTVSWGKADGCTGYQIFYTEAGTGGVYAWWKNIPAGTLTDTLKNLKTGTDYWFKVRSYVDLPDGSRYYGQLSEAKHAWTNK